MMNIPPGTGAKKVFFGAWAFTLLRFFAVLAAAILIVLAGSEWQNIKAAASAPRGSGDAPRGFLYFVGAFFAFGVGTPFMLLADLSTIPAMAIVGGEIPSARLRRRAGLVTFVLQALVLVYVGVVAGGVYAGRKVDWRFDAEPTETATTPGKLPGRPPITTPTQTPTRQKAPDTESAKSVVMVVLAVGLLIQLAYTALYASLYGAGQAGVAETREAEEEAEDRDDLR
jgi:hypothetical protein